MNQTIAKATAALARARQEGAGLLILTGAGMSVSSGVPVFRNADGSMSRDFLNFLDQYNQARRQQKMPTADDWFDFSVPEMFDPATEAAAWSYWRWRILRTKVQPAEDYDHLRRIIECFGRDKTFVVTSNCDGLHEEAGVPMDKIYEIHGSLSRVQCSKPCSDDLSPVDNDFVRMLENHAALVPRCSRCSRCLRPNVMIFRDHALVPNVLENQDAHHADFLMKSRGNYIVMEIGAGLVVPSIRYMAEFYGEKSHHGLLRVNPSKDCLTSVTFNEKYWPIASKSREALEQLANGLELRKE